jgi:hypothetical protein
MLIRKHLSSSSDMYVLFHCLIIINVYTCIN